MPASGAIISEGTFSKVISGLDETVGVVLEYLKDAEVMDSITINIINSLSTICLT